MTQEPLLTRALQRYLGVVAALAVAISVVLCLIVVPNSSDWSWKDTGGLVGFSALLAAFIEASRPVLPFITEEGDDRVDPRRRW